MGEDSREPHPLSAMVNDVEEKKKRLSHVEVKATSDLLSEVRKDHKEALKNHVAPVAKQDLLSAVRTEAGATKKRLSHVDPKVITEVQLVSEE